MQHSPLPSPLASAQEIHLAAIDAGRNIARGYSIWIGRDLFGAWIVETRWGRLGTRGRGKVRVFREGTDAVAYLVAVLKRRQRARQRLSVPYRPVH